MHGFVSFSRLIPRGHCGNYKPGVPGTCHVEAEIIHGKDAVTFLLVTAIAEKNSSPFLVFLYCLGGKTLHFKSGLKTHMTHSMIKVELHFLNQL